MGIIVTCILIVLIFLWIYKGSMFQKLPINQHYFAFAFSLKIIAGFALTWIYTNYYPDRNLADTFRYFDDSYHIHRALFENPKAYFQMLFLSDDGATLFPYLDSMNNWFPAERTTFYNDNRTVIRLNAVLRIFSFGNYYFHLIFFCLLSFLGSTIIFQTFQNYFQQKQTLFWGLLFLTPSILFWSSGILKEGPLLLAFGIALNQTEKIIGNSKYHWRNFLILIACFLVLFHLKFYVGVMLIPSITLYAWLKKESKTHPFFKMIINFSIYFILALIWHVWNWNWSLFTVLKWKRSDFLGLAEIMDAKSIIYTGNLEDNPLSFLIHLPLGIWNTLVRPSVLDIYAPIIFPAAIENTLLLFAIALVIIYHKKHIQPIFYYFLSFSLSFFAIIGLVTPIMGSLVRYKIPGLIMLFMVLLLAFDIERFKEKWTKTKR